MSRLLFCVLFLTTHLCAFANLDVDKILNILDEKLVDKYIYKIEKERKIDALKFSLANTDDNKEKFELCEDIFDEYKAYQYDSAYLYARRADELARLCDDKKMMLEAKTDLLFCYSTVGLFKEGAVIIDSFIPSADISQRTLADFYFECAHFYHNLSVYAGKSSVQSSVYNENRQKYTDLALANIDPNGFNYRINKAYDQLLSNTNTEETIEQILELLNTPKISEHQKAILYSWLSSAYEKVGDSERAIYYRAASAIDDIESCTFETTSLRVLAQYMHERGDAERASKYIRHALEDANIYNTPFRKYEMQDILLDIEKERSDKLHRTRIILTTLSSTVVLLLILVIVFYSKVVRRNARLHLAHEELHKQARELDEINAQLKVVNESLSESNRVKDQYIIQTLYGDSAFVDKVEAMCVLLHRKIKAKLYADIDTVITGIGIKQERQRMSNAFDSAFLKLYPNFIEEYNKLFPADQAIVLGENMELPSEVRVFALIKLGIEDTTLISSYLNVSPNTIYAYKARVKSKTIVPKDEFEERIIAIV